MFTGILSFCIVLLDSYQIYIESSFETVGKVTYIAHRGIALMNLLFAIGAFLLFSSPTGRVINVTGDTFIDFGVVIGYLLLSYLSQTVMKTSQIAAEAKISSDQGLIFSVINIILILILSLNVVIKVILCSVYNNTVFIGYYFIVICVILIFLSSSSWKYLYDLRESINITLAINTNISSKLIVSETLNNFQKFVTYLSVFIFMGVIIQLYSAYFYLYNPGFYFDRNNTSNIPYSLLVCCILSLIATWFGWKSEFAKIVPLANPLSPMNDSNQKFVAKTTIAKSDASMNSLVKQFEITNGTAAASQTVIELNIDDSTLVYK